MSVALPHPSAQSLKTCNRLASFRWITGAPKFACDMTLYIWDAGIDELVVLASFTA